MAHSEFHDQSFNRRTLIKLMALASPNLLNASTFVSSIEQKAATRPASPSSRLRRPRLFYNAESLKQIQQVFAASPETSSLLRQKGEALLRAEFVPENIAETGGGQQANYITPATQIANMGITLGLLYHLTGEEKYAIKLRDALLYYGNYVRWAGPELIERNPPWHSELDTTTFSFGYSAGYDALRGFLSEKDRKTIADTIIRLAVEPILNDWVLPNKRIHSLDSMGHNWWGVCVAGGGLCALALLDDDPRAQSWIDAVDAGYLQWFDYTGNVLQNRMRTFEHSGPSYEGVGYSNYGVSQYLHYRFAWQNVFPGRKWPRIEPLEHLASFFLQTLYPTSSGFLTVNFEDSSLEADSTATLLLLNACGLGTPEASRYLEIVHSRSQETLLTLVHQHPRPTPASNVEISCIYPHMGWAVLRSSWEADATLLAMKSGYTWNHAHADAGSFILFQQGQPLIIDSGTCKYSLPEYSMYYRTSRAHNVVLFDGQGQPSDDIALGCKFPGSLHSLVESPGFRYLYADATGPMARWFIRNYRHWIWSGDVILVIDDVRAHSAGQMDWLLHYQGECVKDAANVRLTNGPASISLKMLYPEVTITTEMGLADHNPDKKIPYLVFRPNGPEHIQQFITAICLNPATEPSFTVQEDTDYLHVQVKSRDTLEDLYLNKRAIATPGTMCIKADGITTDASLLHLHRGTVGTQSECFFAANGSYLRRDGQSLMESLSKKNICWTTGEVLHVFSDSDPTPIQIGALYPPASIYWNGRMVRATYRQSERLVCFKTDSD